MVQRTTSSTAREGEAGGVNLLLEEMVWCWAQQVLTVEFDPPYTQPVRQAFLDRITSALHQLRDSGKITSYTCSVYLDHGNIGINLSIDAGSPESA